MGGAIEIDGKVGKIEGVMGAETDAVGVTIDVGVILEVGVMVGIGVPKVMKKSGKRLVFPAASVAEMVTV
ncbi:MAG: hypothetical protein UX47_C0009G0033 [Candidatus Collierbacteria bacterium GW2011_GWA2_46_26]|uniref:Uncharacterized protein n=1 Tax=Candidatus Collierbacteria bacterium GW2011_GWA2_46_26 TaxID=1618381 RepID=A0A0G1PIM5_9BACT|nr:MAG: hypothetical protein UX47_C0009G0033 [Candidatus Collierbacteria bacterium GW2011_GWA2_46_26]